jgi:hypothetical protein
MTVIAAENAIDILGPPGIPSRQDPGSTQSKPAPYRSVHDHHSGPRCQGAGTILDALILLRTRRAMAKGAPY